MKSVQETKTKAEPTNEPSQAVKEALSPQKEDAELPKEPTEIVVADDDEQVAKKEKTTDEKSPVKAPEDGLPANFYLQVSTQYQI